MILSGHQPEYLPYIGFFNKIILCDLFVLVDHVQFVKKDYQNRNRIRTPQGPAWLTIPVKTSGKYHQKINEVEISNSKDFRKKHRNAIYYNYKKSPYFDLLMPFFDNLYSSDINKLVDINEKIIFFILDILNINTPIVRTSDLIPDGNKTQMLVNMCKQYKCNTYLSGEGALDYVNESVFNEEDLKSRYRMHKTIEYSQMGEGFSPSLSVIDLIFNCGPTKSYEIIKKSGNIVDRDYFNSIL